MVFGFTLSDYRDFGRSCFNPVIEALQTATHCICILFHRFV